MKGYLLLAAGLVLGMATFVEPGLAANEVIAGASATSAVPVESAVDCSKETWPNLSPPCLRNASPMVPVRLVTAPRR